MALLNTLPRCHGDLRSFLLFALDAEPRVFIVLCACSKNAPSNGVFGTPTDTNEDTHALLRRLRSLYRAHIGVVHFSWTQQDRLKDTALMRHGLRLSEVNTMPFHLLIYLRYRYCNSLIISVIQCIN